MAMSPEKRKALEKLAEILMAPTRDSTAFAKGLAPTQGRAMSPEEFEAAAKALAAAEATFRKSLVKAIRNRWAFPDGLPEKKDMKKMPIQELRELLRKAQHQY